MDFSLLAKIVKEKDRGEGEFRTFRIENCLSPFKIFIPSVIISSIFNSKIF
jgi:hypothetical protein